MRPEIENPYSSTTNFTVGPYDVLQIRFSTDEAFQDYVTLRTRTDLVYAKDTSRGPEAFRIKTRDGRIVNPEHARWDK